MFLGSRNAQRRLRPCGQVGHHGMIVYAQRQERMAVRCGGAIAYGAEFPASWWKNDKTQAANVRIVSRPTLTGICRFHEPAMGS